MRDALARLAAKAAQWIRTRLGLVDLVDELPSVPPPAPEQRATGFARVPSAAFGRILSSNFWTSERPEVKIVWLTLLTLADADGVGRESVRAIAALSGIELVDARRGFERLVELGRIQTIDEDGDSRWRVDNFARYHEARPVPAAAS
jgi:hypothetical protein